MATFVIVHGGWGGGWEWREVAASLRARGHDAFAPTLTGLGERAHLAHPGVDLETHLQDVVNVLRFEDLWQVVLVGHSYGGMVITGVADRAPEHLANLVYLDAFVPSDWQAAFHLLPSAMRARFDERTRVEGEGWRVPPPAFVDDDPAIAAWARGRYGPQPVRTLQQPLRLTASAASALPRTFVSCTDKVAGEDLFAPFAEQARRGDEWAYRELPTVHDAQMTMPREVADLLLSLG